MYFLMWNISLYSGGDIVSNETLLNNLYSWME